MSELSKKSLLELGALLERRQLSAEELMQETLERIEATRSTLNAVVAMHPRDALLARARGADQRIASGRARPLEGIPFGVKDLEDAAGLVTTHGSLLYKDGPPAEQSSIQVERLEAAGAIVVGKTNAPEFGHTAVTRNLVYGVTASPWDLARTPGGSSGGSAAAIAGGVLPLATASDGGGSVRIPASFTGAFGLKPSYGRIPDAPRELFDHGAMAVQGPLTKTVADAALILDCTVGHHELDPSSLPHPGLSYRDAIERAFERPLTIAVSVDLGFAVVQSDVARAFEEAIHVFEKLGHRLVELASGPPEMGTQWAIMNAFELAGRISEYLPHRESQITRGLAAGLQFASNVTPAWWGEAARQRAGIVRWAAETFAAYDLLLTPTVPYDPPPAKGPLPTETEGRHQLPAGVAALTIPFNLSWHPAASVRMGLSSAGLPMGLQIVAPHHRDDLALMAARAFERERPWHPSWPIG